MIDESLPPSGYTVTDRAKSTWLREYMMPWMDKKLGRETGAHAGVSDHRGPPHVCIGTADMTDMKARPSVLKKISQRWSTYYKT